jgi:hypothetical protein
VNIFYINEDARTCAQQHVDKHVVKMILEYAQLLSTAHRVLDGTETTALSKSGRKQKVWALSDARDEVLYKATHINHPSAKWARHTSSNYDWLYSLWVECLFEYTRRYNKIHSCARLQQTLLHRPKTISIGEFSAPWRAMPDEFKVDGDTIQSYRNYYNGAKSHMFKWKTREAPDWAIIQ